MEEKKNYKLTVAYDGSSFSGWQVQPNGVSIQEKLEHALFLILKEKVHVTGSGRTDAGVHAAAQIANFKTDRPFDLNRALYSLNGILPPEIRVLDLSSAPPSFHARFSAKGKCYTYRLTLGPVQPPHWRHFSWHIPWKIDLPSMERAASYLIGEHNFSAFTNESVSKDAKDLVRNLQRIDFVPWEFGTVIEFEGNGFLYKMVRNIVGTLVEVGSSKRKPEEIEAILASQDRKKAGQAAPPLGLFLSRVIY